MVTSVTSVIIWLSPCLPPLQSESKCEVFVMVISSTLHLNEN